MQYKIQTILGQVPSKSNSYIIIKRGQYCSMAKHQRLKDYEKSFYLQCNEYRNKNIQGLFELHVKVFNGSQRPDLDNAFKVLLDCLEGCNAIKNDRNCVKIVAKKFVDKTNPRVEFYLKEV